MFWSRFVAPTEEMKKTAANVVDILFSDIVVAEAIKIQNMNFKKYIVNKLELVKICQI